MHARDSSKLPWWLRSRYVLWAWLMMVSITVLVGAGFVYNAFESIRHANLERGALYARVLEEQASRAVSGADLVLRTVQHALNAGSPDARLDKKETQTKLQAALAGQPFLRSLSIVEHDGLVSVSTNERNIGHMLPPALRTLVTTAPGLTVSGLQGGRDLQDAGKAKRDRRAFVTLSKRLPGSETSPHYLLAVVNLDYVATQHELMLKGQRLQAALTSYGGEVLATAGGGNSEDDIRVAANALVPGVNVQHHDVFTHYLPDKESAQMRTARGLNGQDALSSFKALRVLPWVVIVERPWSAVMSELRVPVLHVAAVVSLVTVLLSVLAMATRRSLRSHEGMTIRLRDAHDAMAVSESRRWAVLEASLDGIVTIDIDGHIVDFNKAAEQMFGHPSEDVIGLPMHAVIVPPKHREAHVQGMENYRQTGQERVLNQRIEIEAIRANGEHFPVELTIVPVRCGEERYFTATIRDITERVKMDSEMRSLLRSYKEATINLERQKMALDAHAIVSITDDEGRIVYANAKLQQISGYAPHELLGQTHQILKAGEQDDAFYAKLWRTISRGDVWHGELVNRRKDGARYWVSGTIVPVPGEDGRPRQYISIQTDISAGRKAEFALAQLRSRELDIGSRIQASLLVTPPPAQLNATWLSAYHQASQGIDGDFVDVIRMGDHCVDIVTGDVMGKGVPAALMGAATKLQFSRSIAELLSNAQHGGHLPPPSDIVAAVHRAMTPHLQALDAFVTLSYIRLNTLDGTLTWVGCGHEEGILIGEAGELTALPNQHPPLGVLDESVFQQDTCPWMAGDTLFACSDGVTDALLPNGERVGRPRLLDTIQRLSREHAGTAAIVHRLRQELLHDGVSLTDDLTMILVRHVGARGDVDRLEVPCSHTSLRAVRAFLSERMHAAQLPEHTAAILEVAVVEVVTNVVRHAKGLLAGAPIEIIARVEPDQLVVEVVHLGQAFTPPEHIIEADLDTFPEGGFGLTIVRNACDAVHYLHHDGVNTVRMVLRRHPVNG